MFEAVADDEGEDAAAYRARVEPLAADRGAIEDRLMLMHGMADDNVLFTNTTLLIPALVALVALATDGVIFLVLRHSAEVRPHVLHTFLLINVPLLALDVPLPPEIPGEEDNWPTVRQLLESLAARLAREPRPPFADVRRILRDVADALAYAHARRIIHRDIKPDNILLDRQSGRPIVTDFGIARAIEGDSRLTVTGTAVGTPAYMSPEQAMGEGEIDGRSDLYSLAVVGYQMLAGELPFKASNTPAMLMKHLSDPLRPLATVRSGVPKELAQLIERTLAKKPHQRWNHCLAKGRPRAMKKSGENAMRYCRTK